MKITKFVHACLMVEMPEPVNRTVLFDPGSMSESVLPVDKLEYLDDIVITHSHEDHLSLPLIKRLVEAFPAVRITATSEAVTLLAEENIVATDEPPEGLELFSSPHESVQPLFPRPEQYGYHYLQSLSHPGDSHSFVETMPILALPVTGPWASTIVAINLAIRLKPRYVLPIHDWHWSEEARHVMYQRISSALEKEGITFIPLETGKPVVLATKFDEITIK